jgi:hypothetical protein
VSANLRDAVLALLRRLEWSGEGRLYGDGSRAKTCPVCDCARHRGHGEWCELDACIKALEEEQVT